jgi:hypothetical protein
MLPSMVENMLIGAMLLQTLSAAVGSMSKPRKDYGWYCWFYKFSHQLTNLVDAAFEKKFNVAMPRVIDETTSSKSVVTPNGSEETKSSTLTTTTVPPTDFTEK